MVKNKVKRGLIKPLKNSNINDGTYTIKEVNSSQEASQNYKSAV